ncbi:DUF3320 domain-containing protein [Rhodococcus qingshengii]|uniref:DUF3320 domain-containing protein n=1 Tax=Rhodococcus qingshengii TaxID=334542 RepID=UPI00137185B0|nr:DUF3320 domain-containing protein [Rhodococcus erythropolis]
MGRRSRWRHRRTRCATQKAKKVAKEAVRAVAAEIVEYEGPIQIDRLASLTAQSFGVQRLHAAARKNSPTRSHNSDTRARTSSSGPTTSTERHGRSFA